MFDHLLPLPIDQSYRGHRLGLWILGVLGVLKLGMGLGAIFNGRTVATTADGIPLATFTPDGARTALALFAIWGLGQVLLGLLCALALLRYRGLAPLVFALLLLESVGRKTILWFLPYATVDSTLNLAVNAALVALMIVGLGLSLRQRRARPTAT